MNLHVNVFATVKSVAVQWARLVLGWVKCGRVAKSELTTDHLRWLKFIWPTEQLTTTRVTAATDLLINTTVLLGR